MADTHYTAESTVVVLLEVKYCVQASPRCGVYIVTLTVNIDTMKIEPPFRPFYVYPVANDFESDDISSSICIRRKIKAFNGNWTNSRDITIYAKTILIRFCQELGSSAQDEDKVAQQPGCLKPFFVNYVVEGSFEFDEMPNVCSYLLTSIKDHSITQEHKVKALKLYLLVNTIVLINSNKVVSVGISEFTKYISNKSPSKNLPTFNILYSIELVNQVWCTGINFNELRCLYKQWDIYTTLDLLYIDNSVVAVKSEFSLLSEKDPHFAFATSNYYLILYEDNSFLCDRRINSFQRIGFESSSTYSNIKPCHELNHGRMGVLIGISNLMFDDSYNSDLNGYELMAFRQPDSEVISIRPVLLTSLHYNIVPDFSLSGYSCHRYMSNCVEFDLEFYFTDKSTNLTKSITRKFYVLDDGFSSILPKFSSKDDFPPLHFGQSELFVDQFLIGDMDNVQLSKLIKLEPEHQSITSPATLNYVNTSQQFVYSLRYLKHLFRWMIYANIDFNWFMLRFNSDNTISISFAFISSATVPWSRDPVYHYHTQMSLPKKIGRAHV